MTSSAPDFADPEFYSDPYPVYRLLREESPVLRVADAEGGGSSETVYSSGISWWITRYDDARSVLKDFKTYSHDFKLALTEQELGHLPPPPPLMAALGANLTGVEPPIHTKLRSLVSTAFAKKTVASMGNLVEQISQGLIDDFRERGETDLMEAFAYPLPITVITGILGLPLSDQKLLRKMVETKPPRNQEEAAQVMKELGEAKEYIDEHLERRRRNPTDDLMTAMMNAEVDGERLGEIELFSMIMMVVVAGFETTVNLIGNGMLALFDHPEQLSLLKSEPGLGESAVEEMLRYDSPLEHSLTRWATKDVVLRGQNLKRGDRIFVVLAAANRDPERFENPDIFDIRRNDRHHVSFGHGIHYCLGAPLARVEGPIAINGLLRELPGLRLAVPRDELRFRPNLPFRGLESLPVAWDL